MTVEERMKEFAEMSADEQKYFLKKSKKYFLIDSIFHIARQFEDKAREKEHYQLLYERARAELEGLEKAHERTLEQSGELSDDWNRLKNENDRLEALVVEALSSRAAQVKLNNALTETHGALVEIRDSDVRLTELGVRFGSSSE